MTVETKTILKYYSKFIDRYLITKNFEKISEFQKNYKNGDIIYPWEKALLDEHELLDLGLIDINWFNFQIQMKKEFEENPQEFLREPTFLKTISCVSLPIINKYIRYYLKEIKKIYNLDNIKKYLVDDYVGTPYINSIHYKSTLIRLQHLYQISIFYKLTGINLLSNKKRIIEFGGGYGDLANLIYKSNLDKPTYIIIDLPVLSKIQFLYLKSIYNDNVFLISDINMDIKNDAINIVPLNLVDIINMDNSIFWATYSLTESNFNVLNILKKKNFFGSEHYFIAYQTENDMFKAGLNIANELKNYLNLRVFFK